LHRENYAITPLSFIATVELSAVQWHRIAREQSF
jgi:hypothetical protein